MERRRFSLPGVRREGAGAPGHGGSRWLAALLAALATLAGASFAGSARAGVSVEYRHALSDFSGTIPFGAVQVVADRGHGEVYVADGTAIRVFNEAGMEIYQFAYDPRMAAVRGLAVDDAGDILLLSWNFESAPPTWFLVRCDFRGRPRQRFEVKGLPEEFAGIQPNRLFYQDGEIYLASPAEMLAVVTDRDGVYRRGYDLGRLAGVEDKDRPATEIFGISLAPSGDFLFAVTVRFRVYVVSPDGTTRSFGRPGSSPGRFGLVSGIVRDDHGNYVVTDQLRDVIMVFDSSFQFLDEFGRAPGAQGVVGPGEPILGNGGKLYLTQTFNRGVGVFSITAE